MTAFKQLVRFAIGNQTHYGELINIDSDKYTVQQFDGSPFDKLLSTDKVHTVTELSPPVFLKPADALAGPYKTILIHSDVQSHLDYKGELTFIIGKDAKNVSAENTLYYILGYAAGNYLSARNFQLPETSGGQFCYTKSFDQFAHIRNVLISAQEVQDPQDLSLVTKVNGQVKQTTNTSDMIWGVCEIVSHLSRGTTLRKGTVIMTGTPPGVGFFQQEYLQDGDVEEVEVGGMARMKNKIKFLDYHFDVCVCVDHHAGKYTTVIYRLIALYQFTSHVHGMYLKTFRDSKKQRK